MSTTIQRVKGMRGRFITTTDFSNGLLEVSFNFFLANELFFDVFKIARVFLQCSKMSHFHDHIIYFGEKIDTNVTFGVKIENETEFSCFFGLDPPNISIFIFAQKMTLGMDKGQVGTLILLF